MSELALISKKVKIFSSTTSEVIELTTSATNYGAFQQDLQARGLSIDKMNVVMRDQTGSRTALSFADTPLPSNDFVVLISPAMQKGASIDLKSETYTVLRRMARDLGIKAGANPKKEELIKALTKHKGFKDIKSRKEKAVEVKKFSEQLTESRKEYELPVTERVEALKAKFHNMLVNKPTKTQVTALKEEAEVIWAIANAEVDEVTKISKALAVIDDIISVEAEEVFDEEPEVNSPHTSTPLTPPTQRPSWVDGMSREDAMKDFLR